MKPTAIAFGAIPGTSTSVCTRPVSGSNSDDALVGMLRETDH